MADTTYQYQIPGTWYGSLPGMYMTFNSYQVFELYQVCYSFQRMNCCCDTRIAHRYKTVPVPGVRVPECEQEQRGRCWMTKLQRVKEARAVGLGEASFLFSLADTGVGGRSCLHSMYGSLRKQPQL